MMGEHYNIIAFNGTHEAISAEKKLKESNLNVRIIPVPKEITAGCGFSIKVDCSDLSNVIEILKVNNIIISGTYNVIKKGLNKEISPC